LEYTTAISSHNTILSPCHGCEPQLPRLFDVLSIERSDGETSDSFLLWTRPKRTRNPSDQGQLFVVIVALMLLSFGGSPYYYLGQVKHTFALFTYTLTCLPLPSSSYTRLLVEKQCNDKTHLSLQGKCIGEVK